MKRYMNDALARALLAIGLVAMLQVALHGPAAARDAFEIVARHSGTCLGVLNASTQDTAAVNQYQCDGSDTHLFEVRLAQPAGPSVTADSIVGYYVRKPVENGSHIGKIVEDTSGQLRWHNQIGTNWKLFLDPNNPTVLDTGPDNPFYTFTGGRWIVPEWRVGAVSSFRHGEKRFIRQ